MDEQTEKRTSDLDSALHLIYSIVVRRGWRAPYFISVTDAAGVRLEGAKVWAGIGGWVEYIRSGKVEGCGSQLVQYQDMLAATWPLQIHLEECNPGDCGGCLTREERIYNATVRWHKFDLLLTPELAATIASVQRLFWAIKNTSENEMAEQEAAQREVTDESC